MKCVVAREKLSDWNRLWDDFTQEEIWEGSQGNGQKEGASEENIGLSAKSKKKSKKDLTKVRYMDTLLLSVLRRRRRRRRKIQLLQL